MVRSCLVVMLLVGNCQATPSFVKKTEKIKKSSNQLKQEIAEALEASLTQTFRMIASLTDLQETLLCNLREILTAPSDSFFAQAKPSGLQLYQIDFACFTEEMRTQYALQNQWIEKLTHNFQKG